ncbi:MAG: hypothetical protein ABL956_19050, partial [Hyphomonadaceae bacterium]
MAKASEPTKPAAKKAAPAPTKKTEAKAPKGETPVSSKDNPSPEKSKTGNTASTRPAAQVQGKLSPSTKAGAKAGDRTEATGRDHSSQSEHSAQADVARKLYEQLQAKKASGGAQGAQGPKKGFDPNQIRGGKGGMGSAHGQMLRRT